MCKANKFYGEKLIVNLNIEQNQLLIFVYTKKLYMQLYNLLYEIEEDILTITINRPDKLNALNAETFNDLEKAFEQAKKESGLKGIIVTGSGKKAFVAGADISEFKGLCAEKAMQLSARGHEIFNTIENMSVAVIAAVNGFALGGGCELALACHFRIGSNNAKLGLPEVSLGLIPGYGGTQRLVQAVGKGKALEMVMTGDMIDAQKAYELSLLNHVVEQEELLPLARKIIGKIGSRGPVAIKKAIECIHAFSNPAINGYQYEINAFGELFSTDDVNEGAKAFMEKRKPNFTGR